MITASIICIVVSYVGLIYLLLGSPQPLAHERVRSALTTNACVLVSAIVVISDQLTPAFVSGMRWSNIFMAVAVVCTVFNVRTCLYGDRD